MTTPKPGDVIETLQASKLHRDLSKAFHNLTGLPVSLTRADSWRMVWAGRAGTNRFCAMLTQRSVSCAECLQAQDQAAKKTEAGSRTVIRHGAKFIRPIFISVVLAVTGKLLYEVFRK